MTRDSASRAGMAIAAVGATVRALLTDRYPRDDFGDDLTIELRQPGDAPMADGIAVCLWRVVPNGSRRNLPPPRGLRDPRASAPLSIDLDYLVVPFAASVDRQHRMLGWLLRAIQDVGPVITTQPDDRGEMVMFELASDALARADYLAIQDRFGPLPPFATCVARLSLD